MQKKFLNLPNQKNTYNIMGQCISITVSIYTYVLSHFNHVQVCVTLWTVAHQAPLSMEFPGKNTGVGCHALLQGIFPTQGLNPHPMSLTLAGRFFTTSTTWEAHLLFTHQVVSNCLRPHGLQHARLPCPSLSPGVCSDSCPLSRLCHPIISSSVAPFSSGQVQKPISIYISISKIFIYKTEIEL